MGAFWNPSGGIVVKDKELSNKEGLALKPRRKSWTVNPRSRSSPQRHCLDNIWITVSALFACIGSG